jgi:hypothetical protein
MTHPPPTPVAPKTRPAEVSDIHTRLMKFALEVDDARAYWSHAVEAPDASAQQAFDTWWFGDRSLARIEVLLSNLRARFAAYPAALRVLAAWPHMAPDTRTLICHWHLQLSDPLYRSFTGNYLVDRRDSRRPEVTRDLVVAWMGQHGPERWTMGTHIQFASKLLSSAFAAGLVASNRDPRALTVPRVPDEALAYLMYLLRETDFEGTLLDNPYARSVGLDVGALEERLRHVPGLRFSRQGDLVDFGWAFPDLLSWGAAISGGNP